MDNLIYVVSESLANHLIENGCTVIQEEQGVYTFHNDEKIAKLLAEKQDDYCTGNRLNF